MKIRVISVFIGLQLLLVYTLAFAALLGVVWMQSRAAAAALSLVTLTNPIIFLVFVVVMSIVVLVIVRRVSSDQFWHLFFGIGAFVGITTVATTLIGPALSAINAMIVSALAAVALVVWRQKTKGMIAHHCVVLIAVVGVGVIFGQQFTPRSAMLVVALLSIYDIISVYFTQHMIELARTFFKREVWFGIIIPSNRAWWGKKYTDVRPGRDALVLGAGDIGVPLLFAAAHLYVNGLNAFLIMFASTLVGVVLMLYWYFRLQRGQVMPALPPIAVALLIGHWVVITFLNI